MISTKLEYFNELQDVGLHGQTKGFSSIIMNVWKCRHILSNKIWSFVTWFEQINYAQMKSLAQWRKALDKGYNKMDSHVSIS